MKKVNPKLKTKILDQIEQGYIRRKDHPTRPYSILNYTPKAQYDWHWNEATIICRGLMIDEQWNIVGRAFDKFFTKDQYEQTNLDPPYDDTNYIIFDKLDGILFEVAVLINPEAGKDRLLISTRGSFDNEWTDLGRKVLNEKYSETLKTLVPGNTYCFELLTKESREAGLTVVDYGSESDICLLEVINTSTGLPSEDKRPVGFPTAKIFTRRTIGWAFTDTKENAEGYVVYWPEQNFRLKIKLESYIELHRLLTSGTYRRLYLALKNSDQEAIAKIDEAPTPVRRTILARVYTILAMFHGRLAKVYADAAKLMESKVDLDTRKDVAEFITRNTDKENHSGLFNLYDKKEPVDAVWRQVRRIIIKASKRVQEEKKIPYLY